MAKRGKKYLWQLGDSTDPHGLVSLAEAYLENLSELGYSHRTVVVRERNLRYFIAWCARQGISKAQEVGKREMEQFRTYLYQYRKKNGLPLALGTQCHRLTAVRGLFRWLWQRELVEQDPTACLKYPRLPKHLPRNVLGPEEVERVLGMPDVTSPLGLRDRAMLEVLYSTGLRRAELVGLNVDDLDAGRRTVFVREGKGRVDRMLPIGKRALFWVGRYYAEVRPKLAWASELPALFLSSRGRRISASHLGDLTRGYLDAASVVGRGSCHRFRHSMATGMLWEGADVRYVQQMLGHQRLDSTMVYTKVSIGKLREVHEQTHPQKRLGTEPDESDLDQDDHSDFLS